MSENLGSIHAEFRIALDKLAGDVAKAQALMKQAEDSVKKTTEESGRATERNYAQIGGHMKNVGKVATGAGTAIAGGLGFAVKKAAEFEGGMSAVGAISGASGADLQKLSDTARKMGSSTSFSATEAAKGLEYMALAGWNTEQMMGGIGPVLNLAEAGALDLGRASDLVTDSMAGLGLGVDDLEGYLDKVAKTSASANTDIDTLMEAFVIAGGTFKQFNVPLEESSAFLGVLANRGFKGSEAGTAMNAIMTRLTSTTGPAAKKLKEMGISAYDSEGNFRGMETVMKEVSASMNGMTDAEKANAKEKLAGLNHGKAFSSMLGGLNEEYDDLKGKIVDSDGALKEMRDTMKDNLQGAMENLSSAFEEIAISLGTALLPAVKAIAGALQKAADWFNGLGESTKSFIAIGAAVVAAVLLILGPILILVGTALPGLVTLFGFISGAALPALIASFAPVAGVIAGVIAAAVLLYKAWTTNFGGVRDFVMEVVGLLVAKFNELKDFVMPIITELVSYIMERWKAIQPVVKTVMDAISKVIGFVLPFIFDTVKFYLDAVMNVFKGVFNLIAGIVKFFVALFTGDWKGMWEAVKQMLSGAVQAVWGLFNLWFVGKIAGIFGKFISGIVSKMGGFVKSIISSATSMVTRFGSAIAKLVSNAVSKFVGFFSNIGSKMGGFASKIVSSISSGMTRFVSAIANGLSNAIRNFANFVLDIPKKLLSVIGKVTSIGGDIVKGIWKGISSMGSWLAGKLTGFAKSIIPGPIAKALGIQSPSRLMADEIGHWIPAGVAQGAEDNVRPITDMAGVLAKQVTKDVKGKMDLADLAADVSVKPSISTANRVVQGTGVSEEYNFNGPLIGQATVRDDRDVKNISQALYSRINSKERSKGQIVPG